jgi:hypothetical protein
LYINISIVQKRTKKTYQGVSSPCPDVDIGVCSGGCCYSSSSLLFPVGEVTEVLGVIIGRRLVDVVVGVVCVMVCQSRCQWYLNFKLRHRLFQVSVDCT